MNVLEQANNFAEGKTNQVIIKAIADAYIEGYKAGYKNREEEIPMELRDEKTEYVDLGLPSRTLWSTDMNIHREKAVTFFCHTRKQKTVSCQQRNNGKSCLLCMNGSIFLIKGIIYHNYEVLNKSIMELIA